ncbi:hypothetical protein PR202_gb05001 [Eleusine coracana subsp. coracana]|uniref:Uncharacterized protein n=1 Tax=Eleusine coracana subsp. coracana TaxID=191504 RepID=A0AAV5E5W8_ELECO|nr:hypothetical protein PR202_gb05001 [Eleusine coracana subsp. coracana]
MSHQSRNADVGDAAGSRLFISHVCCFAFSLWLMLAPWYYLFYDLPPQFSVQLAPVGRGLDMSSAAAPIASAFHIALHVNNERATERCYRNGEVELMYAGFTIASGRVPGFCVPGKVQREVPFLAREDGVGLPEHLRDRMAAEHKIGVLELEVQVRLLRAGSPIRMSCNARMMSGAQLPDETMCTVFALQNWFDNNG